MNRQRYFAHKLNGTPVVLDIDTLSVTPCASRTDAATLATMLERGEVAKDQQRSMWFELKAKDLPK